MRRTERRIIENIMLINPILYDLQDAIEKEQERVIADTVSPAHKVVERLVALDNRRIDLCNLKVLYEFIRRETGVEFAVLENAVRLGADSALFERARRAIERAGYDTERAAREFAYLFKLIKRTRRKRVTVPSEQATAACNV